MQETTFLSTFYNIEVTNHYIKTNANAEIVFRKLMEMDCDLFGIDTETMAKPEYRHIPDAALNPHLSDIRLMQIAGNDNVSYIIDCMYVDKSIFLPFLRSKRFVAHYAKFDYKHFRLMGAPDINIGCSQIIAKLIAHAVYPTDSNTAVDLASMCKSLFDITLPKHLQASNWGEPELSYEQILYAGLDPIASLEITKKLVKGLQKYGLERTYTLLKKAQKPICAMELNGIKLDVEKHQKLIIQWRDELYVAKRQLKEITGLTAFTGPKLGAWLHANLPPEILDIWPRTEGATEDNDKLSTDSNTFVEFDQLPIVKPFAEFQKRSTLTSTFGVNLINQICPATGKLHANYNLTGARTGRLSSSKPNLQNLPREKLVRSNFIPSDPYNQFLCADFSQIELRVAAELSRDASMLNAYRTGLDLHKLTAANVSGKKIEDVTKQDRQLAKACFSADTEILTEIGWCKFSELIEGTKVAQVTFETPYGSRFNDKAHIDFVFPISIQSFDNRQLLVLKDRNLSLVATPDHEVVFEDSQKRLRKEAFQSAPIKYVPAWGQYRTDNEAYDLFARFLVMVQADGCLKGHGLSIRFQFQKERKVTRCEYLLNALGVAYTKQVKSDITVIYASKVKNEVLKWMTKDKVIFWGWLHYLPGKSVLDELKHWDGNTKDLSRDRILYRSTVKETLNVLQAIAVCNQAHATITSPRLTGYSKKPMWSLSVRMTGKNGHRCCEKKLALKGLHTVYCVQVPSGNLVIRHQEKVMISGNCNFGFIFGLGAAKFSHYAKKSYGAEVTSEEAKEVIKIFRETYSGYREWQLGAADRGRCTGYSRTPCGKLRKLDPDNTYGAAMNTPVQGGAAECILHALVRLQDVIEQNNYVSQLTNCVHDEILVESPEGEQEAMQWYINDCMVKGFLDVFPEGITNGIVEVDKGPSWGEAKH